MLPRGVTRIGAADPVVNILFGTETGSAEFLSDDLRETLNKRGIDSTVGEFSDVDWATLMDGSPALIIVSTTGEGDMPRDTEAFWERLSTAAPHACDGLRYAVLALGDHVYTHFCHAGKLIDARLAELGGARLADRLDCDAAYDRPAAAWIADRAAQLAKPDAEPGSRTEHPARADDRAAAVDAAESPGGSPSARWTRENPFWAPVSDIVRLTAPDCDHRVVGVELDLSGSGVTLEPGDSLGIVPTNDPSTVERFLMTAGIPEWADAGGASFADLARTRWELRFPSLALLRAVAAVGELGAALAGDDTAGLDSWVAGHCVADAVALLNHRLEPVELADLMGPIRPRAYSWAGTSPDDPGGAQFAVAVDRPDGAAVCSGVAGGYLTIRSSVGDRVPAFPLPNRMFHLPADPAVPIVMVGAGAGVAPYRAFLQQRARQKGAGPAWLIFGNRRANSDFLYKSDWAEFLRRGTLTRLDTAFSRDQPEKTYVQHRIRQRGADLVAWLEGGAYWYVCGDARRMAPAVSGALHDVFEERLGPGAGAEMLTRLRAEKRYRVDVY